MVEPPKAPSPAANTLGSLVRMPSHSVRTRSESIMPRRSRSSQRPSCPTEAITMPQAMSCSVPGTFTGARRPDSSGSPSVVCTQRTASSLPCGTIAVCWVW